MSNVCGEKMEFELIGKQPTFKDILAELNRLKLENKCLKADKQELQKEVIQLKNDNEVLHNKLNENNYNDEALFEGNNPNDDYNEEEWANAYTIADKNYKFV